MIEIIRSELRPVFIGPGDGRSKILLSAADGAANISIVQVAFPAGGKTDPHFRSVEEAVYIVKGESVIVAGAERFSLSRGDIAYIPAGTKHYHLNSGPDELLQLVVFSPQGPEEGFLDFPKE